MDSRLGTILREWSATQWIALVFAAVSVIAIWTAAATGYYFLAGAPAVLIIVFLAIVDFRMIYWLLIAMIPLSTEITLPGGLGTDLPTEPLIIGLMIIFGLFAIRRLPTFSGDFIRHPITILVSLHLLWLLITTLTSDLLLVSVKFWLAKCWYIVTFFFLTGYLIRTERDVKKLFWVFLWPSLFVVLTVIVRHGLYGFSFAEIHSVLHPFQRNHVNYGASLALLFPIVVLAIQWYPREHWRRWFLIGTALFLLIAIYFTYTRAAYLALVIALGAYFIIRWQLTKYVLGAALIVGILGAAYVVKENRYLEFAPNYERTVSHEQFDNLIEATYKLEDISTMERLYRWVAAGHMTPERPFLGWGPGNFVNFYKSFTVTSFQTYVSDNPEKSGIHSYFFMTLVEQGFPGLILLLVLLAVFLLRGESLYHRLAAYPERRRLVLMALLSSIVIYSFLIINDLVETDKIGSFFFIHLAIVVNQEVFLWRQKPVVSSE